MKCIYLSVIILLGKCVISITIMSTFSSFFVTGHLEELPQSFQILHDSCVHKARFPASFQDLTCHLLLELSHLVPRELSQHALSIASQTKTVYKNSSILCPSSPVSIQFSLTLYTVYIKFTPVVQWRHGQCTPD